MEGLRSVRSCGKFLWRGCDWSDGEEYSYEGAVIGQMGNFPMEGLRSVRCCGIFLWRGCDWSGGEKYFHGGAAIGQKLRNIPMEGL
jgi:hypothetical protein